MTKEKEQSKPKEDILGQPLEEGKYVAVSHHNELRICQVTKIHNVMVKVTPLKGYRKDDGFNVYSSQTILLSGPDALAYILTYSGK